MAEKDLRKLKRQDLLELLILQSKEVLRMQDDIVVKNESLEEFEAMSNRLKDKLNEKDEQIERLKDKLNDKDVQIDRLKIRLDQKDAKILRLESHLAEGVSGEGELEDSDLMMQKIYEAAQNAVGLYMKRAEDGTLGTDVHGVDEPVSSLDEDAAGEPSDAAEVSEAVGTSEAAGTEKNPAEDMAVPAE